MEKLNSKIVVFLLFVFLMTVPTSRADILAQGPAGSSVDRCTAVKRWGLLAGATGFVLGLVPGFQPVAIAYGVVALGTKAYEFIYC